MVSLHYATIGFNPTDDGLILAQSYRLIDGQVPHRDFLSPRPVGSPLLHVVDLWLPLPQIYASRIIVYFQILAISFLLVHLIYKNSLIWRQLELRLFFVAIVLILNLHQFPLMPWHTIDGILFSALGLHLLIKTKRALSTYALPLGALAVGFTPLIKQSFIPMILIGIILILLKQDTPIRTKSVSLCSLFIPVGVYFFWLYLNSAVSAANNQLWGGPLPKISVLTSQITLGTWILFTITMVLTIFGLWVKRHKSPHLLKIEMVCCAVLTFVVFLYACRLINTSNLELSGWSTSLLVLALGSICLYWMISKSLPIEQICVVSLGGMVCLSWGYVNPNLISGGLLLVIAAPLMELLLTKDFQLFNGLARVSPLIFKFVLPVFLLFSLIGFFAYSKTLREESVYRDVSLKRQSETLGKVNDSLWGIRSNPRSLQYLNDIKECLRKYPALNMALLPDGAVIPLIFGKKNPFSVDWWTPYELVVSTEFLELHPRSQQSYLVLFQTFPMTSVAGDAAIEKASAQTSIFSYPDNLMLEIFTNTKGQTVYCGSLIGKYKP